MAAVSTNERILAASPENTALLQTLSETEYASSALAQASSYHKQLTDELVRQQRDLGYLESSLKQEQKEHEEYRDSTMKRLAYRMSGKKEKFNSKAEKEEREYLEAVQKHFNAKQQVDHLKESIKECEGNIESLKNIVKVHEKAQADLDALYDSIFRGPTPEYPEEDRMERPVEEARNSFAEVQTRFSTESQTLAILNDAAKFMQRALADVSSARDASGMDIWGVGGTYADMAERSALSSAQSHASQVEMLFSQARRTNPKVNDIDMNRVAIAQGHVMSDIIFDNVFSDMAMHDEIKMSQVQLKQASSRLWEEVKASKARCQGLKQELDNVGQRLQAARKELEAVRSRTFEKVAGGLPAYSEQGV